MPPDRMATDPQAARIDRQLLADQCQPFVHDITFHAVVFDPGGLRGVQPIGRRETEVPMLIVAGQTPAARAGIGAEQGDAMFGRITLCPGLDEKCFVIASETGQKNQCRQ